MRRVYRVLAALIALEVVVQAGAMAFAISGLVHWVDGGGVLDSATIEGHTEPFPEVVGLIVHGINGSVVVPALALFLLIVSFFAGIPRGVRWAAAVLGLVAVQASLGFSAPDLPLLGALHGLNALLLFVVAALAARRVRPPVGVPAEPFAAEIPAVR
jgi:hypothetical protein